MVAKKESEAIVTVVIRSTTADEAFDCLTPDERESAVVVKYHGGSILVHRNLLLGIFDRMPLPKFRLLRWLLNKGVLPFVAFHVSAQHGFSGMATNAWTKWGGVRVGQKWIDEMIQAKT